MHMFKNLILPINDIFQRCLRIALENNLKNKQDAFKKEKTGKYLKPL